MVDINTTDPEFELLQEIQVQLHRIDQTNVHLTEVVQEQARTFRSMM